MSEEDIPYIKPSEHAFWRKPEGITGTIVAMLLAWGVISFFTKIMPFWSNFVNLFITLLVTGLITALFLYKKWRAYAWYFYKNVMRWITSLFMKIDPVSILQNDLRSMQRDLEKMTVEESKLQNQIATLYQFIQKQERGMEQNVLRANKAKEQGNQVVFLQDVRQAGLLKEQAAKYYLLYQKMYEMHSVLVQTIQRVEPLIATTKTYTEQKEKEREQIKQAQSMLESAKSVVLGNPDRLQIFDETMDPKVEEIANKKAEMRYLFALATNFISSVNIQEGTFGANYSEDLLRWKKHPHSPLWGRDKSAMWQQTESEEPVATPPFYNTNKSKMSVEEQYADLFE